MALEYFDGFDDYSVAQASRYWTNVNTTSVTIAANGRNGGDSFRISGNGFAGFSRTLSSAFATVSVGFALRTNGLAGPTTGTSNIVNFQDGTGGGTQVTISVNPTGNIVAFRGNGNGTVLGTSALALSTNVFYYIEAAVTINNTTGSVTVKVNGTTYLNLTGINTRSTANNSCNAVTFGNNITFQNSSGLCQGNIVDYDDLYIDNAGTLYGDSRVESLLPNANGATNAWTANGAASNWQCVDQNPADDDTTYVSSAAAGNIDQYTYPALPTGTGVVRAVMTVPIARDDSAGTTTLASVYYVAATVFLGANNNISSTTYNAYPDIQALNPNTSAAWSISDVNGAQFGVKRVA